MNLDWILSPLTIYGMLASMGAVCLYMVLSARLEMARYLHAYASEKERLERNVAGLAARIAEVEEEGSGRMTCEVPPAGSAIHSSKRSEALRMFRRGSDTHTIVAAVGLPRAEVALLEKVHRILASEER